MKRRISIAMIFVLLLTAAACSPREAVQVLDALEDAVEQRFDTVEDAVERHLDAVEDTVEAVAEDVIRITPAPVPKADAPATEPPSAAPDGPAFAPSSAKPTTGAEEYLSQEQAQNFALEHAKLTAGDVAHLRAQFDMDDGVPEYDVEFRYGRLDYEYEIHAVTGAIRSYDVDN